MLNVKIEHYYPAANVDPVAILSYGYGTVFQMYHCGRAQNTYLISIGPGGYCISAWYCEEEERWELSCQNTEDLKAYVSTVKFKLIDADIDFKMLVR